MTTWEFWNRHTDDTIEVEADTFDEATCILFDYSIDPDIDPSEWELI